MILDQLNLNVKEGSIHSLIGTTGVGKSLLLRLVSGLTQMQAGVINADTENLSFVFQNNSFFSWLTIEKNLDLTSNQKTNEMHELIRRFKLDEYLQLYPKFLSGGTVQKFNLLRAFIGKPKLILMDEPYSHLDIIQREDLYRFTLELWNEYKPTIFFVTHDIDEALYLSNHISFLSKKSKKVAGELKVKDDLPNAVLDSLVEHRAREDYLKQFKFIHNWLTMDIN